MCFPFQTKKVMNFIWLFCVVYVVRYSEGRTTTSLTSQLRWYPSKIARRPGNDKLPYRIDLTLQFRNNVQMNLVREDDNVQSVQAYTKIKVKTESQHIALYRDPARYATFSVAMEGRQVTYYGEFSYNNIIWTLMPDIGDRSEYQGSNDRVYQINLNGTYHYVRKEKPHAGQPTEDVAVKPPPYKKSDSMVNPVDSEARRQFPVYLPDGRQLYTVEIFVILDYSVYKKWYDNSGGNEHRTIANLKQFYAHVINGIKERYEGIVMPGVKYTASLVGYHIIKSETESQFIESTKRGYSIESYRALENVVGWISKRLNKFPQFDVGAVFTSYGLLPHFNGLANTGAACTVRGMSINRDMGSWDTIFTATHEIGHNLGAYHDSEGNNCKNDDQFIMAKGKFLTKGNFFSFSNCSIQYFQKFNQYLYQNKIMCLNNQPESIFPKDADQFLNQHPGQKLTLDQQCRAIYGSTARYCGGDYSESICMRLSCMTSSDNCQEASAAEGTSCADGKWCHRGLCAKDNRAPALKKTCPFGDFKIKFEYDGLIRSCSNLIANISSLCYDEYYRLKCCDSCENLRQKKNRKDCPFGDMRTGCMFAHCYSVNYTKSCCETCKSVKFDSNGKLKEICENEILDSRCHTIDARQCYKLDHVCCTRCKSFVTQIPGCKYGDNASWCKKRIDKSPKDCSSLHKDCCQSCHNKMKN